MFIITEIGTRLLFELLQALTGCIAAFVLHRRLTSREGFVEAINRQDFISILLSALLGLILPVNFFGVFAVFLSLIRLGIKLPYAFSMVASNFLFNMAVPLKELGFSWKNSLLRIGTALLMGIAAGFLLKVFNPYEKKSLPPRFEKLWQSQNRSLAFSGWVNQYIGLIGLTLTFGVVLEVIFKEYFFMDLISFLNINQASAAVARAFPRFNISSDLFLINMSIINLFLNLINMTGVVFLFRIKGFIGYYAYFCFWFILLFMLNLIF